ncbi:hypothetical protein niasHT_034019 [Heterodera trifolii]|uniref:Uncharacterized protein n=1 Tax=Heterodera trifolii TaxID=157864 RepID=A0ABD2I878_9BILA
MPGTEKAVKDFQGTKKRLQCNFANKSIFTHKSYLDFVRLVSQQFLKTPRHKTRRHSDRPRHCAVAIFRRTKSLNQKDQVNGQSPVTSHSTNSPAGVMATELNGKRFTNSPLLTISSTENF